MLVSVTRAAFCVFKMIYASVLYSIKTEFYNDVLYTAFALFPQNMAYICSWHIKCRQHISQKEREQKAT